MSDRMTDERLDRLREQAILQNGLAFHATQELFDELARLRQIVARLRDDGLVSEHTLTPENDGVTWPGLGTGSYLANMAGKYYTPEEVAKIAEEGNPPNLKREPKGD